MKRTIAGAFVAAGLSVSSVASATPSTAFWTPATVETQPYLVPHLTYDTWFGEAGALQIDAGLTVGVLSLRYLEVEVGVDFLFPTVTPSGQLGAFDFAQLNARATVPEGADGEGSPGFSVGISKVGFRRDVSTYDLLHATLAKTTPAGTFGIGAYYGLGSASLWTFHEGETRGGLMASWISKRVQVGLPGLQEIDLRVDLAAGRNWMGGLAGGVGLHFTKSVQLRTGAVLFADWDYYQRLGLTGWLWSLQLDVDIPLFEPRAAEPPPASAPDGRPGPGA